MLNLARSLFHSVQTFLYLQFIRKGCLNNFDYSSILVSVLNHHYNFWTLKWLPSAQNLVFDITIVASKLSGTFFSNFVAFSQYLNFVEFVDLEFDITATFIALTLSETITIIPAWLTSSCMNVRHEATA